MTTLTESITQLRHSIGKGFNWRLFLQDNVTGSWYQTVWIVFLTLLTASYAIGQVNELPLSALITLGLWALGVILVVYGELFQKHSRLSRWLKGNSTQFRL